MMIIVPILTSSLIHFSLKGWENVLFELGSERVNRLHCSVTISFSPVLQFTGRDLASERGLLLKRVLQFALTPGCMAATVTIAY